MWLLRRFWADPYFQKVRRCALVTKRVVEPCWCNAVSRSSHRSLLTSSHHICLGILRNLPATQRYHQDNRCSYNRIFQETCSWPNRYFESISASHFHCTCSWCQKCKEYVIFFHYYLPFIIHTNISALNNIQIMVTGRAVFAQQLQSY